MRKEKILRKLSHYLFLLGGLLSIASPTTLLAQVESCKSYDSNNEAYLQLIWDKSNRDHHIILRSLPTKTNSALSDTIVMNDSYYIEFDGHDTNSSWSTQNNFRTRRFALNNSTQTDSPLVTIEKNRFNGNFHLTYIVSGQMKRRFDFQAEKCITLAEINLGTKNKIADPSKIALSVSSGAGLRGSGFIAKINQSYYLISASHIFRGSELNGVGNLPSGWRLTGDRYDYPDNDIIAFELEWDSSEKPQGHLEWSRSDIYSYKVNIHSHKNIYRTTELTLAPKNLYGMPTYLYGDRYRLIGLPALGASGSAVIDNYGRLIGMFSQVEIGGLHSYVIPFEQIAWVISEGTESLTHWQDGIRVATYKGLNFKFIGDFYSSQLAGDRFSGDGGLADAGDGGLADAGDGGLADAGDGGLADAGDGGLADAGDGGLADAGGIYNKNTLTFKINGEKHHYLLPQTKFVNSMKVNDQVYPVISWNKNARSIIKEFFHFPHSVIQDLKRQEFELRKIDAIDVVLIQNDSIKLLNNIQSVYTLTQAHSQYHFKIRWRGEGPDSGKIHIIGIEGQISGDGLSLAMDFDDKPTLHFHSSGNYQFSQFLGLDDDMGAIFRFNPFTKQMSLHIIDQERSRIWILQN